MALEGTRRLKASIGGATVQFTDFYRGFSPKDSLFVRLAAKAGFALMSAEQAERRAVDLWICGPYLGRKSKWLGAVNSVGMRAHFPWARDRRWTSHGREIPSSAHAVFETAENTRVPIRNWQLSLSFDTDDYGGSNYYVPYWMFATDLLSASNPRFGAPVVMKRLTEPRNTTTRPPQFCAAIFRNPDSLRLRAIEALGKLGTVDVYGPPPSKPLPTKVSLSGKYRFILAFENSLYPGYVTEKLIEAWACGSIPLWYGLLPNRHHFNSDAYVDLQREGSISALVKRVGQIEFEDQQWQRVAARPLLHHAPDISPLLSRVDDLLISLGARRSHPRQA